jgi:DNA-binding NtrC family response regulator
MTQMDNLNILIVDDEDVVRDTLTAIMTYLGHKPESARDGLLGKDMMQQKKFSAAFVDLRMPGIDGMTLLKWARQTHPDLPMIIMTGHGDDESRDEAMKSGAYAFLTKPFSIKEIKQLVIEFQSQQTVACDKDSSPSRVCSSNTGQ